MATTTTYTGQYGATYPHISITSLTENDITLIERIESALLRYARTINHHTAGDMDDAQLVIADALVILEEYGPDAVANAATPTGSNTVEAYTWQQMRRITSRLVRLHQSRRQTARPVNTALAHQHVARSATAAAASKTGEALYWLDAAEQAAPHAHNYRRYRDLVAA